MMEFETSSLAASQIRKAVDEDLRLVDVLPGEMKDSILADTKLWADEVEKTGKQTNGELSEEEDHLRIKMTSFEGAKGLSSQYVFILGLQEGDFPRDANDIQDIEI